jgi:hypothetical protein
MSAVPPKNGPVADTFRRHWRFYRTEGGADAVRRELDALDAEHAAALIAEMRIIARSGFRDGGARHLRGRIWEVRADSVEVTLRALFAKQGRYGQVLLVTGHAAAYPGPCARFDRLNMTDYIRVMKKSAIPDDLDQYVRLRDTRERGFASKVAAAEARAAARVSLGAKLRRARGTRTQTWVAAQMQTTESIVRRIERGDDVRLSTLEKYAQALGKSLHVSVR